MAGGRMYRARRPRGRDAKGRFTRKSQAPNKIARRPKKNYRKSLQPSQANISGNGFTLPDRLYAKFYYADAKQYAPTATGNSINTYNLNNIFDPDETGTGTKVLYYPELISTDLYQAWRVYGCKVLIDLTNTDTEPCSVYIGWGQSGEFPVPSTTSSVDLAISQKNNAVLQLGGVNGGGNHKKIAMYVDNPSLLGLSRREYMVNANVRGGHSSDPAQQLQITIAVMGGVAGDTTGGTPDVKALINMTYYTRLEDLSTAELQS